LITRATVKDTDSIKKIADANRKELGFIMHVQIQEAIEQKRIFIEIIDQNILGFVIFRHRKRDLQTTLAEICVAKEYRGQGIGKRLINALSNECEEKSRSFIQLKCPVDLPSNNFYKNIGFTYISTEPGKTRKLNVWRINIY
jgi:ribosomal protein S18 acetylase RimI-like enzyme